MAGNDLLNASFLDGTGGWTALGGALSVDEAVRGGAGRAVLVSTRTATVGQTTGARSAGLAVTAGQTIEIAALFGATAPSVELALATYSGATLLSRVVLPRSRTGIGGCRNGAASRLNAVKTQMAAPATGLVSIEVLATAGGSGVLEAWLSKPYLDVLYEQRPAYVWDPGGFSNADLAAMARWPAELPPILLEGFDPVQTPIRASWSADSGRESTSRIAGMAATQMRGRLKLTDDTLELLEGFCRAHEAFLFVRPDTQQLCKATWMKDGAPVAAPNGVGALYATIGLQLVVL